MDYETRLTKLEDAVESIRHDIDGLAKLVDRLDRAITELRQHTDENFAKVREDITKLRENFDENISRVRDEIIRQREYTDVNFATVKEHANVNFANVREHADENFVKAREHADENFVKAREHADKNLAIAREHTDNGIARLQYSFDQQFAGVSSELKELRREGRIQLRWTIGLVITLVGLLVGVGIRAAGGG